MRLILCQLLLISNKCAVSCVDSAFNLKEKRQCVFHATGHDMDNRQKEIFIQCRLCFRCASVVGFASLLEGLSPIVAIYCTGVQSSTVVCVKHADDTASVHASGCSTVSSVGTFCSSVLEQSYWPQTSHHCIRRGTLYGTLLSLILGLVKFDGWDCD